MRVRPLLLPLLAAGLCACATVQNPMSCKRGESEEQCHARMDCGGYTLQECIRSLRGRGCGPRTSKEECDRKFKKEIDDLVPFLP